MNEGIRSMNHSYLTFRLQEKVFGVEVFKVLEIMEINSIMKIPQSPSYMRGVLSLHGHALPVIEARAKFGMAKAPDTINSCIVVFKVAAGRSEVILGAVVDSVMEVLEIPQDKLSDPAAVTHTYMDESIPGLEKKHEELITLLNIDKLFSADELDVIVSVSSAHLSPQDGSVTFS